MKIERISFNLINAQKYLATCYLDDKGHDFINYFYPVDITKEGELISSSLKHSKEKITKEEVKDELLNIFSDYNEIAKVLNLSVDFLLENNDFYLFRTIDSSEDLFISYENNGNKLIFRFSKDNDPVLLVDTFIYKDVKIKYDPNFLLGYRKKEIIDLLLSIPEIRIKLLYFIN